MENKKILVGLSGGVDSAVSAYLLKQEGFDITAGFMINYLAPEGEVCPTREDIEVAKEVAAFLDIPFFTFDYREEYEAKVLQYMYEGYKKGITPNPDIMCNSEIKFKVFLDEARESGFDMVATGHYARIVKHLSQFSPERRDEATDIIHNNVVGNYYDTPEYIKKLMKSLRSNQTVSEEKLWNILRAKRFYGFKFRRQHPFGRYIADFYCDELKLVIELDGEVHKKQQEYDDIRDEMIENYDVTILRVENKELEEDLESVLHKIHDHKTLSPSRRELERGVEGRQIYYELQKGIDTTKDQSYFLAGLSQEQLSQTLFPIGNLQKSEVREIAKKIGLPNAQRKDSQGICFVGKVDIKEFLQKKIPNSVGDVVDTSGNILGQHKGVFYYTIGQRKGLDIGGQSEPIFVVKKDIKNNILVVGTDSDEELRSNELTFSHIHFLGKTYDFPLNCQAKIRYRQADQECRVEQGDDGYKVTFTESQRAIASGQVIALYDGDTLFASGIID